ncbi:MAG: desulfoferrodoxin family protein [Pirellulaceae bacterium]
MSERREFLKLLAAGPAAGILVPLMANTGQNTLAAEVESVAELLGRIPENIIYTKERPGAWKGKDGSHVPLVQAVKDGDLLKLTVETKHGMSDAHYIVRHVIISEKGEVLGSKTFSPKDKPVSTYEVKLEGVGDSSSVFVTSFCNLHDLWLAHTKLEV